MQNNLRTMDFSINIIVLAIIALHTSQVSCQVSLIRNFDPQDCIIEGTVITLTCTVEDRNNGAGATIIDGSQAIFNCPSFNTVDNNKIYLRHIHLQSAMAFCGDFVSGQIVELTNGIYIAQINITTTIAMNGEYVECSELGAQDRQQIQLANINEALPDTPTTHLNFESNATFVIHWNQSNEGLTQISHYSINVTGENCGECANLGIVSNVINQLSCTGWEPTGQICNVTVMAATASACAAVMLQLSFSRLVYLQVPEAPLLEEIIPTYSYNLEELQSIKILLAVESTVDPNGVPIMFQVNVERSSQDDIPINCSYKFSAESKCIVNSLETEYKCEIDFAVSSCPQLTLQQVQEADYRIGILVENSIGVSLTSQGHVLSYVHLMVQLLFSEPQEIGKEYNFISIIFSQNLIYAKVTSMIMIEYGPNCQALDNQASIIGLNVTTLTFPVPIMDNICCIVTINNASQSLAILGSFTIMGNSCTCSSLSVYYLLFAISLVLFLNVPLIFLMKQYLKIKRSRSLSLKRSMKINS